jgi:hypothetical protein
MPFTEEYFEDLGVAYRAEVNELYELGCRRLFLSILNLIELTRYIGERPYPD